MLRNRDRSTAISRLRRGNKPRTAKHFAGNVLLDVLSFFILGYLVILVVGFVVSLL